MDVTTALIIYFVVFICLIIVIYGFLGIHFWSTIALSSLICLIVLDAICSPIGAGSGRDDWPIVIYIMIHFATLIILLLYILDRALRDREYVK